MVFFVISENLKKLTLNYKSKKSKILKVPILTIPRNNINIQTSRPVTENYIFHAGSLFENKDGISDVFKAFAMSKPTLKTPFKFLLTGSLMASPHSSDLLRIIKEYQLSNDIIFTGYLNKIELENYLSHASLAIINKKRTKQNLFCFPTKITDYINFNIPIIMTNIGELTYYFQNNNNAYIAETNNVESLKEKIILAVNNQEKSSNIAFSAKQLTKNQFNTIFQGKNMHNFLNNFS